jgi:multidrug resistance efflux pump
VAVQPSENRAQTEPASKQTVAGRPTSRWATPVPTPWYVRWREFRATILPPLVFCAGVVVAVICWRQIGTATGVAGMGEGVRASVTTPFPARLQQLLVQPYQVVKIGDPIAIIAPNDPRIDIDLLQTELAVARLQYQPTIAEENAMNFEQIRVDLLRTKAELSIAKVNLERFENQVRRNTPLFKEQLVSEDIYDLSLKSRDLYAVEVFEKSNAVAQIEMRLRELETLGLPQVVTNSPLLSTLFRLRGLQESAVTNWGPITLRAPIHGMVTSILRQEGENVIAGEPLASLASLESHRIVGYLRQPYNAMPEIGTEVVMTTRERQPRRFSGHVTEIGAHVEVITNALAYIRPGSLVDAGLPVIIRPQEGFRLRPGEVVDLSFRLRPANTASPRSENSEHTALQ